MWVQRCLASITLWLMDKVFDGTMLKYLTVWTIRNGVNDDMAGVQCLTNSEIKPSTVVRQLRLAYSVIVIHQRHQRISK